MSFAGIPHDKPGIGWAIDQLFIAQPTMARTVVSETLTDISLDAWMDVRAGEMIQQGKFSEDWYIEHSHEIITAPRRLGAILIFDVCKLRKGRINYNAKQECSVTHRDMVELETLFRREVGYWA